MDLVLTIGELAVFPFAMAAIGGYLAAKVLDTASERKLFIGVFTILFVFGYSISAIRETRVSRMENMRSQTIDNMYGQIQTLVGAIAHPSPNQEHQQIFDALHAMAEKLKISPPVIVKPPPASPTPEQALHVMPNQQLRDYTTAMANKMRDFETQFRTSQINAELARQQIQTSDRDQLQQIWTQQTQDIIRANEEHENQFKKQLWGNAYALRTELLLRLKQAGIIAPTMPIGPQADATITLDEGRLLVPEPITDAANYLELLARALPA